MIQRLLLVLTLCAVVTSSAGCLVVHDRRRGPVVVEPGPPPGPRCHPSQYWDGYVCRHKGRGHEYGDHHDHDDHGYHR